MTDGKGGRAPGGTRQRAQRARLRRTRRGVIEVPLELTIVILVLAIVLPIVALTFLSFEQSEATLRLQTMMAQIVQVAGEAYQGGNGTVLTVALTGLPSGSSITLGAGLLAPGGDVPQSASYYLVGFDGSSKVTMVATLDGAGLSLTNTTGPASHAFVVRGPVTLTLTKVMITRDPPASTYAYLEVGALPT